MPITSKFICLNGHFLKEEDLSFTASNRAFRYGDGFFETMHYANGEIQLFDLHQARLKKAMNLLKLESSVLQLPHIIHKEIVRLNNANHFFKGARVRISIFRSEGGLYLPLSNKANYLIESWPLENDRYLINSNGFKLGAYKQISKPSGQTFFYKSLNSQVSILASLYAQENNLDNCFIINDKREIIESINSNVFFIQNKTIYTPNNDSGCIYGIMREKILTVISQLGFTINNHTPVKEEDISQFDEIFLSNAIQGIQWVGAYKTKRFDSKITKQIQKALIQEIFKHSKQAV